MSGTLTVESRQGEHHSKSSSVNTGAQLTGKDPHTFSGLVEAERSYLLTRKDPATIAWTKNMMLGTYMEQAEKKEREVRYGINQDPEYFKKGLSVTLSAVGSKGIDKGTSSSNSYIQNGIKPVANAIWGESSPKIIDDINDKLKKDFKVE